MLGRLRQKARSWRGRRILVEVLEHTRAGCRHWLVVPSPSALRGARDVTAVGFFGDLRCQMDHVAIYDLEAEVVARVGRYAAAGLLSYDDAELEPGLHGNLVLFGTREVPAEWHMDIVHARAVALAPVTIAACACTGVPSGARSPAAAANLPSTHPVPRLRARACPARAPPVWVSADSCGSRAQTSPPGPTMRCGRRTYSLAA
jgi:hypothetical protein